MVFLTFLAGPLNILFAELGPADFHLFAFSLLFSDPQEGQNRFPEYQVSFPVVDPGTALLEGIFPGDFVPSPDISAGEEDDDFVDPGGAA